MKNYVSIAIENDRTYEFEFSEMSATLGTNVVRLSEVKCGLEDKIKMFNAGVVTCFSNVGSIYIDITKAKYVAFEVRK